MSQSIQYQHACHAFAQAVSGYHADGCHDIARDHYDVEGNTSSSFWSWYTKARGHDRRYMHFDYARNRTRALLRSS